MAECSLKLRLDGKPYPRTCPKCGISGKCQDGLSIGIVADEAGTSSAGRGKEGVQSPMGWFYRVDVLPSGNPTVYRCKLGTAWERPEVYDITDMTPDELRFVADVIDASKSKSVAA
jgi:hypothetical protein